MSNGVDFSGSFKRFLKGDLDPLDWKGINPTKREKRENAADRERRASQIAFEQGDELLEEAGGSTDEATKQVKKLRRKTQFSSFSPFAPPDPAALLTSLIAEVPAKKRKAGHRRLTLKEKNAEHARTALTAKNLVANLSVRSRLRPPILGALRAGN